MKRIIMMVLRNLLFVPWGWFMLNRYAKNVDNYTEGERYALLKKIVRRANKGGNITVQSYGVENIPNENGFMFYPNHQGLYDVLAIVDACPTPFSVVAKKEVGNVPFLKQVFTCMKAYIMDREDIRQSMQVILDVTKEVKAGRNYLIFAEGTRSKNGNHPLEFKGGSFKAATKARCPIVPVALKNCFVPFDSNTIRPVTVEVHFLDPIPYEEYQGMKTTEIAEMVKKRIEAVVTA